VSPSSNTLGMCVRDIVVAVISVIFRWYFGTVRQCGSLFYFIGKLFKYNLRTTTYESIATLTTKTFFHYFSCITIINNTSFIDTIC